MKVKSNKKSKAPAVVSSEESKITLVPLDRIVEHPEMQYRPVDKSWASELKQSIAENGLDVPIIVWNGGGDDVVMEIGKKEYPATFLIAGRHRRKALELYRKEDKSGFNSRFESGVPCLVVGGTMADALSVQLRENLNRKNATARDVIPLLKALHEDHKLRQKDIASRIGMSESWVSQMLDLKKSLGEDVLDEVVSGDVDLAEVKKAASHVKSSKKKGVTVDPKEAVKKAKEKSKSKKSKNRQRAEKRPSAKVLLNRYRALPSMKLGAKVELLESILAYVAKESDDLPSEVEADEESE